MAESVRCFRSCPDQCAALLFVRPQHIFRSCVIGKVKKLRRACLFLAERKIHAVSQNPRRCSGLQPECAQPGIPQALRESLAGRLPVRTRGRGRVSLQHNRLHIGAGGHDHCSGTKPCTIPADGTPDGTLFNVQRLHTVFHYSQVRLLFQKCRHPPAVCELVALHPQTLHAGTFAGIQHFELQRRRIRSPGHHSPKCIDLSHHDPLCRAAHTRIARHGSGPAQIHGHQTGVGSHSRSRCCRFNPGMPGADHQNIKHGICLSVQTQSGESGKTTSHPDTHPGSPGR